MTVIENDCCNCAAEGYPCTGEHKRVKHYYCDKCKQEFEPDELYIAAKELCAECLLKQFKTVEESEE